MKGAGAAVALVLLAGCTSGNGHSDATPSDAHVYAVTKQVTLVVQNVDNSVVHFWAYVGNGQKLVCNINVARNHTEMCRTGLAWVNGTGWPVNLKVGMENPNRGGDPAVTFVNVRQCASWRIVEERYFQHVDEGTLCEQYGGPTREVVA